MDTLQIQYGVQGNGMTFTLGYSFYKKIKEMFPNAQPAKQIFVEYDMKTNFEQYHAHLEKYIFPALLGFPDESELKRFKTIEFVRGSSQKITYKIEQNNEQTIQPVFGREGE